MVSEEGDLVSPTMSPSSLTIESSYRCDDFIINPYPRSGQVQALPYGGRMVLKRRSARVKRR